MELRKLGRSDLEVTEICLGTMQWGWTADEETSWGLMDAYLEAGGNFLDTADVYSRWAEGNPGGVSEEIIGRWMADRGNRDQIVLATKCRGRMWDGDDGDGLSKAHILRACEDSLRRLQTDCIDLYQAHAFDSETPIDETMEAFDQLVQEGKVRYLGASNYPAWRMTKSLWASDKKGLARYESLQPHYNLIYRDEYERELSELCKEEEIGVIPYSPLQGGFLTGKYRDEGPLPTSERAANIQTRFFSAKNFTVVRILAELGQARHKTIPQMALGWLLSHEEVTSPIIGANTFDQLDDCLGAVGLRLDEEEMSTLGEASALQQA